MTHRLNKRGFIKLALCAAVYPTTNALAGAKALPHTQSLRDSVQAAVKSGQPLIVMVSLPNCPFCKVVRENYLMELSAHTVPVVQVDFKSAQPLQDFDGIEWTQDQWIKSRHIHMAPTLLFLGDKAKEVAPRLEGVTSWDFYGAYLDERIEQARTAIQQSQSKV